GAEGRRDGGRPRPRPDRGGAHPGGAVPGRGDPSRAQFLLALRRRGAALRRLSERRHGAHRRPRPHVERAARDAARSRRSAGAGDARPRRRRRARAPQRDVDAAPEQVWLLDFTEDNGAVTVTGLAFDNQTIAAFMRNLGASKYFVDVDLVETTQTTQKDAQLKKFVVKARLSYGGQPTAPAAP